MNSEELEGKIDDIIKISIDTTPPFIRGLLIPHQHEDDFYYCIDELIRKAKKSEEYWEMIQESTRNSEKGRNDFINTIIGGKIEFNKEKIIEGESKKCTIEEEEHLCGNKSEWREVKK